MKKKSSQNSLNIAIVIPRFHPDISGGAERLAADYADLLSSMHTVTVLTTTATDYITWKNVLPPGSIDGKYRIIRFNSARKRKIGSFNRLTQSLYRGRVKSETWLQAQGPYCPALTDYIAGHKDEFDVFIYLPYLYYTTVAGLKITGRKSILVPALHDERAAYLDLYKKMMTDEYFYLFNTPEEKEIFTRIYGYVPTRSRVAGLSVTGCPQKIRGKEGGDYYLAIGRVDAGKGIDTLAQYFSRWSQNRNCKLVIAGSGKSGFSFENVEMTGFVPEEEKCRLLAGARALINPSFYESFSIVLMEAWLAGLPVIVNGQAEVLKGHVLRSNGGLYYTNYHSFAAVMDYLESHSEEAHIMGVNGRRYVEMNYSSRRIGNILEEVISGLK